MNFTFAANSAGEQFEGTCCTLLTRRALDQAKLVQEETSQTAGSALCVDQHLSRFYIGCAVGSAVQVLQLQVAWRFCSFNLLGRQAVLGDKSGLRG